MKRISMLAIIGSAVALRLTCNLASPAVHQPVVINFQPAPLPTNDSICTSTREITNLSLTPDGSLWVGTRGGVLLRDKDGTWHKFTRLSGLPSHEVRSIHAAGNGSVQAVFPSQTAQWQAGQWQVLAASATVPDKTVPDKLQSLLQKTVLRPNDEATKTANLQRPELPVVLWHGTAVTADLEGLRMGQAGQWRHIGLPASKGTHISALIPHGDVLWAALFGDGLWSFNGTAWQPVNINLPVQAQEITALAGDTQTLWVGTRREGVWQYEQKRWIQHLQPDEPYDHNCQQLALFHGALLMSTLEDGLAMRTAAGWSHISSETLSANAPRQMVEFNNSLYIRQGTGKVDRFDGAHWIRDSLPWLPRKKAMTIATDHQRLYIAQWGGWSEFDGKSWVHHFDIPELQGLPLTVLYPQGNTLWIGTQSRGIAAFDRATSKLTWCDERVGLPDDWITCMVQVGDVLYAGTFVGGLARYDGKKWQTYPQLKGENVTALEPDESGGIFIATRTGVWHESGSSESSGSENGGPESGSSLEKLNDRLAFLDSEVQALKKVSQGLWVGTRTGLFFLKDDALSNAKLG